MHILFVSPRSCFSNNHYLNNMIGDLSNRLFRFFYNGISLGFLILSSLTPNDIKISLVDENFEDIDFNISYDLVAITAMTQQADRAYEIADLFRSKNVKVVMGGVHATVLPEEAKKHSDYLILGEAEKNWPLFIKDFQNGCARAIYKNKIPINMITSPIPRYDLLNPDRYKIIWVQTTRGCPYNCEFCISSRIFGSKYRHKSVDQVIEEIKYIKKFGPYSKISFADDNMFVDKKFSIELIERLKPLNIRWMAQTDITHVQDEKFIKLLRRSGCMTLFIGLESINDISISTIDKFKKHRTNVRFYEETIQKIQYNGIGVLGAFVLGFDTDDSSIFDKTINFILKNNLYSSQITILTPLPGTKLRERLATENRLLKTPWANYTFTDVNFIPKNMSIKKLEGGLVNIYKTIYSPGLIKRRSNYFKNIFKARY